MVLKVAAKRELEAGLYHATTGKLCEPISKRVFFELGKDKGSERRGMGSAFHQLCPRYNGTLTATAPTAIRLGNLYLCCQFERVRKQVCNSFKVSAEVNAWKKHA